MKIKKRLPIFKKKVIKRNPFQFKCCYKRNTPNVIGKERVSKMTGYSHENFKSSFKLQTLLLSQSKNKIRSNILIDKRIGQNSNDLSEEEKSLGRYAFHLQRKHPDSQINLLSEYNNSIYIDNTILQSKVTDFDENDSDNSMPLTEGDLLKLRTRSINVDSVFKDFPNQNSKLGTNLMEEVDTEWRLLKCSLLSESRNNIDKTPNSYDIVLGKLMSEERTNRYSPKFQISTNNVEQEFSSEFVSNNGTVPDHDMNQDNSITNHVDFQKDFSEKLAKIKSIDEYHVLVQQYISSLLSIDSKKLMDNISFLCDQLIDSMFTTNFFNSHEVQYIDHVYGSLCQILSLHSKFTMKYFFMRIKSMRKINKHYIDCKLDKNRSILVLYFLLSLVDVGVDANYPLIKYGITIGVEFLSKYDCKFSSEAGFLLLLIDAIMSICLTMKRFVPEVFSFLTSFISLYTKSSETICYHPFSNSPCYTNFSEFQVSQIEFSQDNITDWNFLFSFVGCDQSKFISYLLHIALGILSRFFKTCMDPFSHFGILLLPLIDNLKHLQKRLELPIGIIHFIEKLISLINTKLGDRNVKLGLVKFRTKSLKFLNLEDAHSSKTANRVCQDRSKQTKKYTRHHKSEMMRVRKDNFLSSHCFLRQQLSNDRTRKAKVDRLQNCINEHT